MVETAGDGTSEATSVIETHYKLANILFLIGVLIVVIRKMFVKFYTPSFEWNYNTFIFVTDNVESSLLKLG